MSDDPAKRMLAPMQAEFGVSEKRLETGQPTPVQAAFRIRELRKGIRLPEGMTIRSMINEGRD